VPLAREDCPCRIESAGNHSRYTSRYTSVALSRTQRARDVHFSNAPIGIRIGKLQQPRSILAENRVPHPGHTTHSCQINHITSVTTRMVPSTYALHRAGRLATFLLPSLPSVCLFLCLSRLLQCASIRPIHHYPNILVALVLILLPKATSSSLLLVAFPLSLFPILSSPLSLSVYSGFFSFPFSLSLSLLLVFFLRSPSSDSEFRTYAA
jgi:hypothetical protein